MQKLLSDLNIGDEATIITVVGEGRIRRRLFDMGVTPGAKVYLKKKAPLGDPIEVTIRGYELSLRKDEAMMIKVNMEESK